MQISFRKQAGIPALGVLIFWSMRLEVDAPARLSDSFIPELFYDYFFVQQGEVGCEAPGLEAGEPLPQQFLKPLFTRPLTFVLDVPLVLYGARLSLKFAEQFWEQRLPANSFVKANWATPGVNDLATFASRFTATLTERQKRRVDFPMLSPGLKESDWLVHFSPRHRRRLYKRVYGISRKEMLAIQSVHSFLGQTCDFTSQRPRIIEYIDSEVFYDQPHLNRAFRKMTGFSPLDYFEASSILQDNLMAASYNEMAGQHGKMAP